MGFPVGGVVRMKKRIAFIACIGLFLLSACGAETEETILSPTQNLYQKEVHVTYPVERGKLFPQVRLTLQPSEKRVIQYYVREEGLEIESIQVAVGEKVNKGQILVSFVSDELKKNRQTKQDELERCTLLYDHYSAIAAQARKEEVSYYQKELEKLQADMEYARLCIEEADTRIRLCQIVAEEEGYISSISAALQGGMAVLSDNCISELVGENTFQATTTDNYPFQVGDTFTVNEGTFLYEMTISNIEQAAEDKKILTFVPNIPVTNQNISFELIIDKPVEEDAVYVRSEAIYHKGDLAYVYVMKDNGFLDVVEIVEGEKVGFYTIVEDGLKGGEEVAAR